MHRSPRGRKLVAPLAAVMLVAGLSGCHWFGKDELYAQSAENRPLEVPPDLDMPATDQAMILPAATSVTASGMAAAKANAPAATGFVVAAEPEVVFAKLGEVLATTKDVNIVSKAALLGSYDVDYQGAKFLLRVTKAEGGAFVSAVDPRGLAPQGEAAGKLIAALKAAIAP